MKLTTNRKRSGIQGYVLINKLHVSVCSKQFLYDHVTFLKLYANRHGVSLCWCCRIDHYFLASLITHIMKFELDTLCEENDIFIIIWKKTLLEHDKKWHVIK